MDWLFPVTAFIAGVSLGGIVTFLVQRSNRLVLAERIRLRDEELEKLTGLFEEMKQEQRITLSQLNAANTEVKTLETKLDGERKRFSEKELVFEELEKRFSDVFKAI